MTRKQWRKYKKVIEWFYNQPEGTKIWFKYPKDDRWRLISEPSWVVNGIYVINDELAEIRKAIAEGKQIQGKIGLRWTDIDIKDPNFDPELDECCYRIKFEIKYPVYKKNDFMVVKRIDPGAFAAILYGTLQFHRRSVDIEQG